MSVFPPNKTTEFSLFESHFKIKKTNFLNRTANQIVRKLRLYAINCAWFDSLKAVPAQQDQISWSRTKRCTQNACVILHCYRTHVLSDEKHEMPELEVLDNEKVQFFLKNINNSQEIISAAKRPSMTIMSLSVASKCSQKFSWINGDLAIHTTNRCCWETRNSSILLSYCLLLIYCIH